MSYYPSILERADIQELPIDPPNQKFSRARKFTVPVETDLMKVIGYYLAEGYVYRHAKRCRGPNEVHFAFGKNQKEFHLASELAFSLAQLKFRPRLYLTKACLWHVEVYSRALAQFLEGNFGTGASRKKIPMWIILLPAQKTESLLDAYLRGDGYRAAENLLQSTTVSWHLGMDLKLLGERIGYICGFYRTRGNNLIQGRLVNAREIYVNSFSSSPNRKRRSQRYGDTGRKRTIAEIRSLPYSGPVYNLEVANDNSYCTGSHSVHNCGNGDLEAGGEILAGEREMTKGTETKMRIVQKCPLTGGKFLGTYHVHIQGPLQPSRLDLLSMMGSEEQVLCTGKDDKVVCLERKTGTGPTEIRRTVRRLTEAGLGELPDEQTYRRIVGRHFFIRDFSLGEEQK